MTIRRDLNELVNAKLVERTYGQVKVKYGDSVESIFAQREVENLCTKQQIAQTAFDCLCDVESIFIDGSSTCNELAKMLPDIKRLTVFTNSVASLHILSQMNWVSTFVIGGFLASDANTLDGDVSINVAKNIFVDAAFISCSGFSVDGFVNDGLSGTHLKKIMLKNSERRYLLVDHSKFNKRGTFLLGGWDKIDMIITDKALPKRDADAIERQGVKIAHSG